MKILDFNTKLLHSFYIIVDCYNLLIWNDIKVKPEEKTNNNLKIMFLLTGFHEFFKRIDSLKNINKSTETIFVDGNIIRELGQMGYLNFIENLLKLDMNFKKNIVRNSN